MSFLVKDGNVYIVTDISQVYFDSQYHTDLAYNSSQNSASATVSDYTGVIQTNWTNAITFDVNGTAQSVTPTNGVATVSIDPNVVGSIAISTTVSEIRNGSITFVPNNLATSQASKIVQLRDMYSQSLSTGVNVAVGGTAHYFACTADDIARMDGLQTAITKAFLVFPVLYSDYQGSPVTVPDQPTLDSIQEAIAKFANAQHQQILALIGQVQSTTSVDAVNAIQWSNATY